MWALPNLSIGLGATNQSRWLALLALSSILFSVEAKDRLEITKTDFNYNPTKLFYFRNSESLLFLESTSKILYRSKDEGKTWKKVDNIPKGKGQTLTRHPYDDEKAILSMDDKKQFYTSDRGETWSSFEVESRPAWKSNIFSFHSSKPGYVIYIGSTCDGSKLFRKSEICQDVAYYTKDFFKTAPKKFLSNVSNCVWAKSSKALSSVPDDTIFCIKASDEPKDAIKAIVESKLVWSQDFFESKTFVDFDFDGRPDGGVIGFTVTEKFMIAAVRRDIGSEKLSLFVSQGKIWAEAHIPKHESLLQNAFTILDSSPHSVALDVVFSSTDSFGTLLFSNSNGTYFTESLPYTNRDHTGIVDMERVQGLDHMILSNIVQNWKEVERDSATKKLVTKITFNNGGEWYSLTPPKKNCDNKPYSCDKNDSDNCGLHLHSVSTPTNLGPVFSRESAPGILIGVGSVGPYLKERSISDTFLSRDGGLSWTCARNGPHKYILGDMGSLVALIKEGKDVSKVLYSYDQGDHWNEHELPNPIEPSFITSEKASTSQSIIVFGEKDDGKFALFHIDFAKFLTRKCKMNTKDPSSSKDFEAWSPKPPSGGDEFCVMGHKTTYYRRKPDVECYVGEKFKTIETTSKNCPCSELDYECDYGYTRDSKGNCVLDGKEIIPKGECSDKSSTYMGSSGYLKIPGNTCDQEAKGAKKLDEPVKKPCNTTSWAPAPAGKIRHQRKELGHSVIDYFIFPDSESFMVQTINGELWTTMDTGASWKKKLDQPILKVIMHPYDSNRAYILHKDKKMSFTSDLGKSFTSIDLPSPVTTIKVNSFLSFHPDQKDYLLFMGGPACPDCHVEAYFSKDQGKSWKAISTYVQNCQFAKTPSFSVTEKNAILCSGYRITSKTFDQDKQGLKGRNTDNPIDLSLIKGDDLSKSTILKDIGQFTFSGSHLIVSKYDGDKLNLYVANKELKFDPTKFPPDVTIPTDNFVVHETSENLGSSVFLTLEKMSFGNITKPTFSVSQLPIGSLFTSSSRGESYSLSIPDLRVSDKGLVDFEEMLGIRGIAFANQLSGVDQSNNGIGKTSITFDNGGSWTHLTPPKKSIKGDAYNCEKDKCNLHVHTFFENHQKYGVFGTKTSGGRVIAVGNVGPNLLPYRECSTFASSDSGLTWREIRGSEALYSLGDAGNLMVMVDDESPTRTLQYSLDGGEKWQEYVFSNDLVRATNVITTLNGDSLKFMIFGFSSKSSNGNSAGTPSSEIITVDFEGLYDRKCKFDSKGKSGDFKLWNVERVVKVEDGKEANKTECLLGSKLQFWRKKDDAMCYVGQDSPSLKIKLESCECNELDFECDVNYYRSESNHGQCLLYGQDLERPANCTVGSKYPAKSGYRKIASSSCKEGLDLTKPISKDCLDINGVNIRQTKFESDLTQNFYFRESSTLLIRTGDGEVWVSQNEGFSFHKLLEEGHDRVVNMMHHPYIDDTAYFVTVSDTHYYTHNEGRTITAFNTPLKPNVFNIPPFSFHPEEPSWAIFIGTKGCEKTLSSECRSEAFLTKDNGAKWVTLGEYVKSCGFLKTDHFVKPPKERIFCEVYTKKEGSQNLFANVPATLKYSDDQFETSRDIFEDTIGQSFFYEYMVVAINSKNDNLITLKISMDGENFTSAVYPPGVGLSHDGFTVLESNTHSLFLHVTTSARKGQEMGPLLISNSNGTYFSSSLEDLNRDGDGFVDFEKMAGVEGIALANQVINPIQLKLTKVKKIQSKISFDNGATWNPLSIKGKDSKGEEYHCKTNCSLHIHSFTERSDPENIFSIPSAIGLMAGVGNYGPELLDYDSGDTFLTNNAGKHWSEIAKGPHRHEFGDSGGLILLVPDNKYVDYVQYSRDMGASFQKLHFGSMLQKVKISDTAIEPQSTSQKFVLLGKGLDDKKFVVTYIDFTGLHTRQCVKDDTDASKSDFEMWSPSMVRDSTCFFGHEVEYMRRKPNRDCYIGQKFKDPEAESKPCPCTREDYECDYNYEFSSDGSCKLVEGLQPNRTQCDKDQTSYTKSSGYRKIPISKCQGGEVLDKQIDVWCPGKGLSGWTIFLIVIIPMAGLAALLYSLINRRGRRGFSWIPTTLTFSTLALTISDGIKSLLNRLGLSNIHLPTNDTGYQPIPQYDYDMDADYIQEPNEVMLDDLEFSNFAEVDDTLDLDQDERDGLF